MLDFDKLDKTIHEKGRLAIMTLLASRASWANLLWSFASGPSSPRASNQGARPTNKRAAASRCVYRRSLDGSPAVSTGMAFRNSRRARAVSQRSPSR